MIYSSSRTVFASHINTLIVSKLYSSLEKNGEIFDCVERAFRSTNSTKDWISFSISKKATTQEDFQKTHADISSTVNFSSNNGISFCGESRECQKKNKI